MKENDPLIAFARKAVAVIREDCLSLSMSPNAHPFFSILSIELGYVEERLDDAVSLTLPRVSRLLADLERLAKWSDPSRDPASSSYKTPYPRLALVLNGEQQKARKCIRKLAEHARKAEERKNFQLTFRRFSNVKRKPRGPELSDLTKQTTKPMSDEISQCLQELHSTLCQLCCCTVVGGDGDSDFKANVALNTVAQSTRKGEGVMVDMFLLHRHYNYIGEWKEARIKVFIESLHADEEISKRKAVTFSNTGKRVSDFCSLIRSQELGRLKLSASINGLFDEGTDGLLNESTIYHQAPSVPLAKVLASDSLKKHDYRKTLLSYLLAKAAWLFYDSDWMSRHWTKDTVHFMQQHLDEKEKLLLNHQPFLLAELKTSSQEVVTTNDAPRQSHIFPRILALGIMLLEIQLGQNIEDSHSSEFFDANGQKRPNADHITAAKIISSKEWKSRTTMLKAVKQAIEICVKPDTSKLGSDDKNVRAKLYDSIVAPLGKLFKDMYECPDECPEKFDPGAMEIETTHELRPIFRSVDMPTTKQGTNSSPVHVNDGQQPLSILMRTQQFQTYDQQAKVDTQKYNETKQWMDEFKLQRVDFGIGRGRATRIRIAILDTGIDMKHPKLENECRIKDFKTFDGGHAGVDESGHGTHIAGIVLDLTNNTDLYIWKFTESRASAKLEESRSRERIAEALRHARTEWKVHIISLSFGFTKVGKSDLVQQEIEHCLAAGIIVFASASNDGGNSPRTYPGNYDGVLCIHSATAMGDGSSFSPTPKMAQTNMDNFSAVGEFIRSYWPCTPDGAVTTRCMSGTSFATPVAVSIAAFMVGYIERKMRDVEFNVKPLSPTGMRKIFRLLSSKRDGYDWLSPQFFFNSYNEDKITADIRHELRGWNP